MRDDDLARELFAQTPPALVSWRGADADTDLRSAMADIVELVEDNAAAAQFAETMQALGLPADSYKAKILDLGGLRCIARIDFFDLSGDPSFVKVFAASAPLGSITEAEPLRRLATSFAEFGPRSAWFFQPAHVPLHQRGAE